MHVAVIMDGNRRWAKNKGWTKLIGHKTGVELLHEVLEWCPKYGVNVFTVYALSTENLQRDPEELKSLFDLIKEFAEKKADFVKKNIRVKIMGRLADIREDSAKALEDLESATQNCTGVLFQICVSYGGRDEIVRAIQKFQTTGENITEENLSKHLDSALEPDLIIRTGGKKRLSNFLMWQSAYSELYFLDKMWPEFTEQDLKEAVQFLQNEQRNFGK